MKNLLFLLLTGVTIFSSCNDAEKTPIENTVETDSKSKFYKEIVKINTGDFCGLLLNENIETTMLKLDKSLIAENESNFILYKLEETYTNSTYELIFKDDKLVEILFDSYVYDEKGMFDKNGSLLLFNDIKADFLVRFGNKYMETSDEINEILYWSVGDKNIQLIHEIAKASVHVYLDVVVVE